MPGPMIRRQFPTPAQGFQAVTATLPAPIGGWNARDSLAAMNPTDAVTMQDWWPMTSDVMFRKGYSKYATGLSGQCQTVIVYNSPTSSKLFGVCSSGNIYDCTSGGAIASAEVSGMSTCWMQYVNVGTGSPYFTMAVNGSDALQYFDGTNWWADFASANVSAASWVGGVATVTIPSTTGLKVGDAVNIASVNPGGYNASAAVITAKTGTTISYAVVADPGAYVSGGTVASSYSITGVSTADCIGINLFKKFVFLIQKSTLKAWYLPVNSVAGAANSLDFSGIARKGGYLMAMGTWTLDAGYGADDYAVFITSQGEVIVFAGTDPSNANTWALIGVWQIGSPLGRRCYLKWGGDILLISYDGIVPLAQGLQSSRLDPRVNLSDKIKNAMSTATQSYGGNQGWQLEYNAKNNMLLLNVPVQTGSLQQQYAMNTITKAWANFTGYSANCFGVYKDDLYFGANGYIGKAWDTFTDNGSQLQGTCLQAFSQLTTAIEGANAVGGGAQQKHFTMMRPTLLSNGSPGLYGQINVDFDTTLATAALSSTPAVSYASWDSAVWDGSVWGGGLSVLKSWQGAGSIGYWGAPQIVVRSSGIETHWVSTDVVYRKGGVL